MKFKKISIILTGTLALIMSMNINASSPISNVRAEISQTNSTRTIDCTRHEWIYKTVTAGNDVFYNYECRLCGYFKYDEWIKK